MQHSRLDVVDGLVLPFYPMLPTRGRTLRGYRLIEELHSEIKDRATWLAQPILAGVRGIMAVVDRHVYLQDGRGNWYQHPVKHSSDFLKLPNRTVMDGVLFRDEFHPFDIIALDGSSLLHRSASEREALAYQMVRLVEHPWMFPRPSKGWLVNAAKNRPMYEGVVLKEAGAEYVQGTKPGQRTLLWLMRNWS